MEDLERLNDAGEVTLHDARDLSTRGGGAHVGPSTKPHKGQGEPLFWVKPCGPRTPPEIKKDV